MEAIKNIKMVEAARHEARNIIEKDPQFKKFLSFGVFRNTPRKNSL
jgi:hypothetical protein